MKERNTALRSPEITIPNVRLGLEDLLGVIHSLDEPARARVARALAETEMDARFKDLIAQLAARAPAEDVTDADIDREVQTVRKAARPA
jgi:HEAT repeat protein